MSNRKVMMIHLIVGLIKKIWPYKMSYFSESAHSKKEIKISLNFSTCATKSGLAKMADLESLKQDNELDIDKLKKVQNGLNNLKSTVATLDVDKVRPGPVDLKNLSDAVKYEGVKKT